MSEASHDTEQIELTRDELAALGEAAPSEAEQLLLRGDGLDAPEAHADPSVASVARLAELAAPLEFEDLSELELHRGWRGMGPGRRLCFKTPLIWPTRPPSMPHWQGATRMPPSALLSVGHR